MGTIRDLILKDVEEGAAKRDLGWLKRHEGEEPRLFLSSLGGCARKAFHDAYQRVEGHPWNVDVAHPFDTYLLEKFKYGNDWEDITFGELSAQIPGRIVRDVHVGNDIWAGRIDYLVGGERGWGEARYKPFVDGAIIEHKTTNTWNFTYSEAKRRLPFESHLYQVLAYQKLFEENYDGLYVPALLYYRSANNLWAEFDVWGWPDGSIVWCGEIVGHEVSGRVSVGLDAEMARFEGYWKRGELPPRYPLPTSERFGCTKRDKSGKLAWPACKYFGACWGNMGVPIEVESV